MIEINDMNEVTALTCGPSPWSDPNVVRQQYELTEKEFAAWTEGAAHGPFDAFRDLITIANPASVLDVGCGVGYYSRVLNRVTKGCTTYEGRDSSLEMIRFARERFAVLGRFAVGNGRNLNLRVDDTVDLVVEGCLILHETSWRDVLLECCRVAMRWVILHRTPYLNPDDIKAVRFYRAEAYGKPILQIHFSKSMLFDVMTGLGCKFVTERTWNDGMIGSSLWRKDHARTQETSARENTNR